MKKSVFLLIFLLLSINLYTQIIFDKPLSPRIASYDINVKLDVDKKILYATETIDWRNATANPTDELHFHLYLNAFKSDKTTFNKESAASHRGSKFAGDKNGWSKITSLKIAGSERVDQLIYIRPDDGNKHDSTVVMLPLEKEIMPGEPLKIEVTFEAKLPKVYARSGFKDNFFLVGQWFPKLGVLEEQGWNCHQYHGNSEFYSDFGVYNVQITVPKAFTVGASGISVDSVITDSVATYRYRAEDIHDFAWTACDRFLKETREVRGVEAELLYPAEHAGMVERYFNSIDMALKYYGEWFMPYPYPKITMVDPPLRALAAGGMEYPMFITCGSIWELPDNIRFGPEMVTIHEFGHNYFYGLIASNEFEEAWIDEGMNSYAENRITALEWGFWSSLINIGDFQFGDYASHHRIMIRKQRQGIIYQKSWEYDSGADYGFNSYGKPSLMLRTLENYLGWNVMQKIWKEFFHRFAFKHPKTGDFIQTVEDVSGQDMSWFFDQYLYSDAVCDYKVRGVRTKMYYPEDSTDTRKYKNKIYLMRNGDGTFPIKAQVVFSTQDTVQLAWDGKSLSKVVEYIHEGKVIEVDMDPELKNLLDINWTNNSWRRTNSKNWLRYLEKKYMYLLQNVLFVITN